MTGAASPKTWSCLPTKQVKSWERGSCTLFRSLTFLGGHNGTSNRDGLQMVIFAPGQSNWMRAAGWAAAFHFSCICEFAFFIAPLNKLANRILWFLTLLVQSSKNVKGYFGIVYTISYIGHDKDNTLKGKRIRACL